MRVLRNKGEIEAFLRLLRKRALGFSKTTEKTVQSILSAVKKQGDAAVKRYTNRFDLHELPIRIRPTELKKYAQRLDRETMKALGISAARIRRFHERQKETSWSFRTGGAILGQIVRPIERVGVYVPGGKASYPSTVLMNIIPAKVAGVKEIAICVPAPEGEVNPAVMAAIQLLGVNEVYRIGGVQAIGALAFGTETVKRVDKIVGPGNIYVALAKRAVFGLVDIDMIAGPSEILIIADKSAPPWFVAADMLSQAEHDEMASSIVITNSEALSRQIVQELKKQLSQLKRKEIARSSLRGFGAIIITRHIDQAFELANEIAPEHLEIMTENPKKDVQKICNAGAVFLGQWSPEPLGDYSAGPNHTLPTSGTARFFSPLGVYDFIKRTSLLHFNKKGFTALADTVTMLADIEGFDAHANTIRIRKEH